MRERRVPALDPHTTRDDEHRIDRKPEPRRSIPIERMERSHVDDRPNQQPPRSSRPSQPPEPHHEQWQPQRVDADAEPERRIPNHRLPRPSASRRPPKPNELAKTAAQ